jgi:4-amino-4-deoxy-L-arabinose transferase-like glycosyltransferase
VSVQPYSANEPHGLRESEQEEAESGQVPDRRRCWLRYVVLALIAALAGLAYAWAANQDNLEPYYAGTVRSMSVSWHNFIFGAVDPAGTISLDKLPGAFWLQALAVRAFGFHAWVIVLPQAVEGVLTVLVLYRAVSRLSTPTAGLIAAAIVAVSPATVALNRGNISDSLMILLLVLAYLLDGPGPLARRVRQLVIAGIVAAIVSLAWMTAVSLVPPADRPYADGSSNDSVYAQVFVYNGFGRFGDQTPPQLLASQIAPDQSIPLKPASPYRLLTGNLGRDDGWLLPAALLAAIWGIASRWRRPRGDTLRACFVLWGTWLLILATTFSTATYIQTYYTAALTPAIAAILAVAAVALLNPWTGQDPATSEPRREVFRRIGLAIVSAGTTAYAVWLVPAHGAHVPGWLVPAIAIGAVAVVLVIGSTLVRRAGLATTAAVAVFVAALATPAVASTGLAANHESAFDTPFESPKVASQLASQPARLAQVAAVTIPYLQQMQDKAPDLAAVQSSYDAAVLVDVSGLEVLPIGGFTGTIPSPTLSQLKTDILDGQFHLVVMLSTADPRMRWIADHCQLLRRNRSYFCIPADAG